MARVWQVRARSEELTAAVMLPPHAASSPLRLHGQPAREHPAPCFASRPHGVANCVASACAMLGCPARELLASRATYADQPDWVVAHHTEVSCCDLRTCTPHPGIMLSDTAELRHTCWSTLQYALCPSAALAGGCCAKNGCADVVHPAVTLRHGTKRRSPWGQASRLKSATMWRRTWSWTRPGATRGCRAGSRPRAGRRRPRSR